MKKLALPCLVMLLACCCSKSKPKSIDNLFEQFHRNGVMQETRVSKFQFDTSEAIIVTGLATNCALVDSNSFGCVPGGANHNLNFTLRNLSLDRTVNFNDIWLMLLLKTRWQATKAKIAPGAQVEIFSFNLKDLHKQVIETWYPGIPEGETVGQEILLDPGIYEFTWVVGMGSVSKPLFFEIR